MWNLSFRLPHQNLYAFLISTCAKSPTHLVSSWYYHHNSIEWAVWARNIPLCNFHQFHGPSSYAQISVSILFSSSSAHLLPFMLRVQTSHPCEAPINLHFILSLMSTKAFEFQQLMMVVKKYWNSKCICANRLHTGKHLYNMANCWKFQIASRTKYYISVSIAIWQILFFLPLRSC